jgi:UDP-N-acetylglucosamine--N-acetylmuramyl-(pentapeptide) pyrophosphoryl-undecaprenol N-acetylglucosamine transferase
MGKRLLVMAGGTGGHVFPGLAVANMLRDQGWEIHWLGCATRMEADLVPKHNIDISYIDVEGVRGNGILRLIKAPFKLIRSVWQARAVINTFKPDVVLGMGGFASGPGGIAARLQRLPLVLHEQNAVAGLTNRYLAKVASQVMVAFDGALMAHAPKVVGNPVRQDIIDLGRLAVKRQQSLNILIVGGSLGAQVLNETLPKTLMLLKNLNISIKHQAGKNNSANVMAAYESLSDAEHENQTVDVSDFIDDMAGAYQQADLVICRAGALTVSEVAALGLPAIFIPLPNAVDDHQTKNAKMLSDKNAAIIMAQSVMTPQTLADSVREISAAGELEKMHQASESLAKTDATEQVARVIANFANVPFVAQKKMEIV